MVPSRYFGNLSRCDTAWLGAPRRSGIFRLRRSLDSPAVLRPGAPGPVSFASCGLPLDLELAPPSNPPRSAHVSTLAQIRPTRRRRERPVFHRPSSYQLAPGVPETPLRPRAIHARPQSDVTVIVPGDPVSTQRACRRLARNQVLRQGRARGLCATRNIPIYPFAACLLQSVRLQAEILTLGGHSRIAYEQYFSPFMPSRNPTSTQPLETLITRQVSQHISARSTPNSDRPWAVAQTVVFAPHFRLRRRRLFGSPVVPSTFTLNPGTISTSIGSGIGAMSLAGCLFRPLPSGFCVSPAMKEAKRTRATLAIQTAATATEQPDASHHASPAGDKNSQLLSCGHLPPAPRLQAPHPVGP